MTTLDTRGALTSLGWPRAVPLTRAVRAFQTTTGLLVDGIVGPVTTAALRAAVSRSLAGQPTLSPHFSYREFRCGCGGAHAADGCAGILALPTLVAGLERVRVEVIQGPIVLRSGYRCPRHNAKTPDAAPLSQHQWGAAADGRLGRLAAVRALGVFSGLGRSEGGEVLHVDCRHASGHNTTRSAPGVPAIWTYS